MRRLLLASFFVSLPLASVLGFVQPLDGSQSGLELSAIDRQTDPCQDFYQFACGEWMAKNPIPADRSTWGRFSELSERNNQVLRRILETAVTTPEPGSRQIGDYYASCMDEPSIDQRGAMPLAADLARIAAVKSAADLPALVAHLHAAGVSVFFEFGSASDFKDAKSVLAIVGQGGLGLPDRDYYLKDDARSLEILKVYEEHVGKMLALTGVPAEHAAADAATVVHIERTLARHAMDAVSRRDPANQYHKLSVAELQALTPDFQWRPYLQDAGAPAFAALNVSEPEFLRGFNDVLATVPIERLMPYLRWQLARESSYILSSAFVQENFRFYGTRLQGIKELRPRWRRCVQNTDADLGEALAQVFVKETFGPQAKSDTLAMVRQIQAALARDVGGLDWMTDATRKQALSKLRAVEDKIGYPEKWRDYGSLRIVRGDAFGNSQRARIFEFKRQLARIGKPVDKSEWLMTPPTVNAYYNPLENNINFPAGILQPPFYSAKADAAVNYGGAGAVIGHELTHGFDDQGRKFDGAGNMNDWWSAADAKAFDQRTACLVDQYAQYTVVDDIKLNGRLTLGENTADNGGLRIALMAYLASPAAAERRSLDGFTPEQRVFLGFGQIWCENRRPEVERLRAVTDPHAPARYRVNGVVSNLPEFQRAFSCRADAPMVRPKACRVW